MVTVGEWNALDYLGNEEAMTGYLQDALEEEGLDGFLDATADVMKARAILLLSRETGVAYRKLCEMFTGRPGGASEISLDVLAKVTKVFAAPLHA